MADVNDAHAIRPSLPAGPTGIRLLETVEELSALPDGTVAVWHSRDGRRYERQAGVLDTNSFGTREIRPVSLYVYESNTDLWDVTPPIWVLTFDDPPFDAG